MGIFGSSTSVGGIWLRIQLGGTFHSARAGAATAGAATAGAATEGAATAGASTV